MAMRLIRTEAPAGAVVEDGGRLWRVLGPSPHWAGEAECEGLTCPRCGADVRRVAGDEGDVARCERCEWSDPMVPGDLDAGAINTAIEELILDGLWVEENEPVSEVERLRAAARRAHDDLMELSREH